MAVRFTTFLSTILKVMKSTSNGTCEVFFTWVWKIEQVAVGIHSLQQEL